MKNMMHFANMDSPAGNGAQVRSFTAAACGAKDMRHPSAAADTQKQLLHSPKGNLYPNSTF